ncbi:MAG: hypothetical protein KDA93_23895 [Planctomycetaceae bacterium]|nr:hypothetical protein [Planctomycetaceae bacterium]
MIQIVNQSPDVRSSLEAQERSVLIGPIRVIGVLFISGINRLDECPH